jgi:hypothetical protein
MLGFGCLVGRHLVADCGRESLEGAWWDAWTSLGGWLCWQKFLGRESLEGALWDAWATWHQFFFFSFQLTGKESSNFIVRNYFIILINIFLLLLSLSIFPKDKDARLVFPKQEWGNYLPLLFFYIYSILPKQSLGRTHSGWVSLAQISILCLLVCNFPWEDGVEGVRIGYMMEREERSERKGDS